MPLPIEIDVNLNDDVWDGHVEFLDRINEAVTLTLEGANTKLPENLDLSILLTNAEEIQHLNKNFREKDKPTNVLSFPQADVTDLMSGDSLGDIILAYEIVDREAQETSKTFNEHAIHLLVHGLLHILGYDHICDEDAKIMEGLEQSVLAKMGIDDPYVYGTID